MQNFDSLFAVNVRAPYFLSSSSCEPRLGRSRVLLASAAHAALTNSQLMQPPRERSKP
jgi:NAD(P)-dependent dehydrogenase (short-subunit alcohol dehydrogenase family)